MAIISTVLRAGGMAAILLCAAPVARAADAPPAAVAADSDYEAFRATADTYRLFDGLDAVADRVFRDSESLNALSPAQREVFMRALHREFAARRDAINDAVMRHMYTDYSRDEAARLVALSRTPLGRRIGDIFVRSASGDDSAIESLSNDPDVDALSPADRHLLGGFFKRIQSAINDAKPAMLDAAQAAYAEAAASPKN